MTPFPYHALLYSILLKKKIKNSHSLNIHVVTCSVTNAQVQLFVFVLVFFFFSVQYLPVFMFSTSF